jgi:hypothetical protein
LNVKCMLCSLNLNQIRTELAIHYHKDVARQNTRTQRKPRKLC